MAGHLWQVTAKRNNGKLTKVMTVEIYKTGTTGKPNQEEISEACESRVENIVKKKEISLNKLV